MTRLGPLDAATVLGLDPSLTGFGYAWAASRTGRLVAGGSGLPRLRWYRDAVRALVEHLLDVGPLHLAVIEGLYASSDAYVQERSALFWWTVDVVDSLGVPVAVAPPAQVKMIATGKGSGPNTDKPAIVAAARDRLGFPGTNDNEADALWLAALGYHRLGRPLVALPQQHVRALTGVAWPPDL